MNSKQETGDNYIKRSSIYYKDDQIEEDVITGAFTMYGREGKCTHNFGRKI
jgi:hypothetical protein